MTTAQEAVSAMRTEIENIKKDGEYFLQDAMVSNDMESGFVCGGIISTCDKLLVFLDTLELAEQTNKVLMGRPIKSDSINLDTLAVEEKSKPSTFCKGCIVDGKLEVEELPVAPEVDLEKEIKRYLQEEHDRDTTVGDVARHFSEFGRRSVLQEIYDGKCKPVDKITAALLGDQYKNAKI